MFGSRAPAIVAVSLVAVVGGLLLAWWQWTRYQSATGTPQNLGYVLIRITFRVKVDRRLANQVGQGEFEASGINLM